MSVVLPDAWLSEDPLPEDPFPILQRWQEEAFAVGAQPNPHAIALATVDSDGKPSARMVLCKAIDVSHGAIVFYTDRSSRKGAALSADPRAAAVFYFGPQNRQVRIEGAVTFTTHADSDAYFASRPSDSQVGAWASNQSRPLASRAELVGRVEAQARSFGATLGDGPNPAIPRPEKWGGYILTADAVELWVSRPARIHDRAVWTRTDDGWTTTRLEP
jgi:pyridoxamine 5'-phosphate oxidase